MVDKVVDGIARADNGVRVAVGDKSWEWNTYYDPISALNPQFYRCAKIVMNLPGKQWKSCNVNFELL